jgi:hypothetical protein
MGTGENPGEAKNNDDSKATDVAMVPGGNPGGGAGREVEQTSTAANPNSPAAETDSSSGATAEGQFIQGGSSMGAGSVVQPGLSRMGGSVFAIVVAIVGLMAL